MPRSSQLILGLLNGIDDKVIKAHIVGLESKAKKMEVPSETCLIELMGTDSSLEDYWARINEAAKKVGVKDKARLYIHGHGDCNSQTIASFPAAIVAGLVAPALKKYPFSTVSITACEMARDKGASGSVRVSNSADSFAWHFCEILHDKYEVTIDVYARVYDVAPDVIGSSPGKKKTGIGQTLDWKYHREQSKVLFRYENGKLKRYWANYALGVYDVPELWDEVS